MVDWYEYWNTAPGKAGERDFLKQVGRTVNGKPIPEGNVNLIVADVVSKLNLQETDSLLDLCCGNGLITAQLSPYCRHITAVDFSEQLIGIANHYFKCPNITYAIADVRQLPEKLCKKPVTKILMNCGIQHFAVNDVYQLFKNLKKKQSDRVPIFLTSIPDKGRLWNFYNTPERRDEYHRRIHDGTEAIGTWWYQAEFADMASSCGYTAECFQQNPDLDTAHYRFDALLYPSNDEV